MRGVVCCSTFVSCLILMNFNPLTLVRKAWVLVSSIGSVKWGLYLLVVQGDCKLVVQIEVRLCVGVA